MPRCEHVELSLPLSVDQNYSYVRVAKHKKKDCVGKILFVLDYMPSEDLRSGRLLSGATGQLFDNLMMVAKRFYKAENSINDFDWLAVTHSMYKTSDMNTQSKEQAKAEFDARLRLIITKYKPNIVVTFGTDPFNAINSEMMSKYTDKKGKHYEHFYGVPIKTKVTHKKVSHIFKHVPSLPLNPLVTSSGKGEPMYLAGYIGRNLVSALNMRLTYKIPKLVYDIRVVDNLDKFNHMMKDIRESKLVAIDTETSNLNRIVNKLLIIQFAPRDDCAYILPICHKDSTWLPEELKYIKRELKAYFEYKNKNEEHLYTNAVFDLNRIGVEFGVRFFKNNIYDMFAGEYAMDENMKVLVSVTGGNFYSLLNLTMQYGCRAYYTAEFGKDKRTTIEGQDLDGPLLEYCALDVIVLHHIRRLQMERAKVTGYKKFHSIVTEQISDMLHTFSRLELKGSKTDIGWLFHLKSKESPLLRHKKQVMDAFMSSPGVVQANKLLTKASGAPSIGLFGSTKLPIFNIRKKAHITKLFFEVLKLKPLSTGKSGGGNIDKKFQSKYSDVAEVALYQEIQKVNKLMNSYVKAFIKQWGSDPDMRYDSCIRPYYQFRAVVTGRTSATKPSLHQIPSRNSVTDKIKAMFPKREDLGKAIKRLFVAAPRRVIIKVDYAAHEVRGWSIISGDREVAELFWQGLRLRRRFKLRPTPALAKRIEYEGDVHKINAAYFFVMPIETVDKPKRDSVKQVIFGLIYQQGMEGVAESTGNTVKAIKDLVKRFFKRFPVGAGWFERIKKFSVENLFVESPLGRRRHLWAYLIPKDAKSYKQVFSAAERRAVNSPIQGMGSDYLVTGAREVEKLKYEHYRKTKHYPDFYAANSVHDSLEYSVAYDDVWLAIRMIEEGLTTRVQQEMEKRHDMEFPVPLEIDFEIGANIRDAKSWDYSLAEFDKLIKTTLEYQKDEMGYDVNMKEDLHNITRGQYADMPDWAKKQAWNLKIRMDGMSNDPRKPDEVFKSDKAVDTYKEAS
jgi:DNA polymerase I-like protein with 3'-5' exonuclease and polymerase domains